MRITLSYGKRARPDDVKFEPSSFELNHERVAFALALRERRAANFMMAVVKNAHEKLRSTVYDEFHQVST